MPEDKNMQQKENNSTESEEVLRDEAQIHTLPDRPVHAPVRKNKMIMAAILVVVLIVAGTLFFALSQGDEPDPAVTDDTKKSEQVEPEAQAKNVWIASYYEESGTKTYQISSDGTEVTEVDTAWQQSQSGKYVAKRTDAGVVVAPVNDLSNETIAFPIGDAEVVDFVWFEDADELLVRTYITANPEDNNGGYWIPVSDESVYVVAPNGGEPTRLYDHTETYGSLSLIGASRSRGEFYWSTSGEGGERDAFNVSSLDDGTIIKKLAPRVARLDASKVFSSGKIYFIEDSNIVAMDMDTEQEVVLYETGFAGVSDTALNDTCSVVQNIESIILDSGGMLFFSTVDNQKHQTTIQQLDIASKQATTLHTFDSVRQINVLARHEQNLLFSRGRVNTCNNKSESYDRTNLFVLNTSTSGVIDTGLSSDSLFYTGSAGPIQLPL